jgi:16S rRNA (guanine1516-N2)-methyltransferase
VKPAAQDPDLARVRVQPAAPHSLEAAEALAAELGLPLALAPTTAAPRSGKRGRVADGPPELLLVVGERLELRESGPRAAGAVFADFTGGAIDGRRRRGGGRKDPIARAIGLGAGTRRVLDATAGLGRDAFLFAWLGCEVTAVERSRVVAALLRDALARARAVPEVDAILAARLHVVEDDARQVLAGLPEDARPDAVYIDPMYPPRRGSALNKKEMRVLRAVVGCDEDAAGLLDVALRAARRRVVVKRHARSPALDGAEPDFTCAGRSTRFDVYLVGSAKAGRAGASGARRPAG